MALENVSTTVELPGTHADPGKKLIDTLPCVPGPEYYAEFDAGLKAIEEAEYLGWLAGQHIFLRGIPAQRDVE